MENLNVMHILLLLGLFAIVVAGVMAAWLAFAPRGLARRLAQIGGGGGAGAVAAGDSPAPPAVWVEKLAEISQPISRLSLPKSGWENSPLRLRLINAGWRSPGAAHLYFAAKTVLALTLPAVAMPFMIGTALGDNPYAVSAMVLLIGGFGFYLPNAMLSRHIRLRQRKIIEDFPDALDLLTVCVEAGLGLDAALTKVADELRLRSPIVADELGLMLLEIRSGFAKDAALRNLALRTGAEDVDAFCAMLIQADRFGTSIGASLRVLSDTLRTQRRMRAEERAAKIALKLLFPLIFCIFPALLTVLLGPAFIHIYRTLLPTMASG
ncbi:type II secretion system F family protein [Burkholderia humptydooensis]|uniref:Type II secretion system F family protein n=3 Tax=Burkholderia humptydooensis TaxID=430531 RepID=A0A7U4SW21_9BURK|nr:MULTISPECIES: type II secretion system F family protein [Burkholderia]AJY40252.1 type II secretion system (T2SS), F family protein [Burkholderia sp. 2002721687]ALX46765.1 type II secretion system protein [Burkholderia humptydooensis]QPS46078.1 type II secretion system F family protein [Burkholderia humptydooensis]